MSYDTTNVVGVGHVNAPSDGVAQGIYEQSSRQMGPIGARRMLEDGRVFRYAQFVGACAVGKLAAVDASVAVAAEMAATAVVDSGGSAKDYASSDEDTVLYFKDTDILTSANADNVFAGGYLVDHTDGYTYKIRDNDYTASTSIMQVELYDPLIHNMDSEHEVSLTGHPYNNLVIANSGTDDMIAGVPLVSVTADYFAWVQTWGVCGVLCDGATTVAAGTIATLSDDDNGGVQTLGGNTWVASNDIALSLATEPIVGYFISAGTDTNYVPVFLQLAP